MNNTDDFVTEGTVLVKYKGKEEHVTVPGFITELADRAFYECDTVTDVSMPNVTKIGETAFMWCKQLERVDMPRVISVGETAFLRCKKLKSVSMPLVRELGLSAFHGCISLADIQISDKNEYFSVENGAIYSKDMSVLVSYQTADGDLVIPESVLAVCDGAVNGHKTLRSIYMPNVRTIGKGAFSGFPALDEVAAPNVETIGECAFSDCLNLKTVYMPKVQVIEPEAFEGCSSLTNIVISPENNTYCAENGIIYDRQKTKIVAFPSAKGDIVLPDYITEIGAGAFSDCKQLRSVKMPYVRRIEDYAFSFCESLINADMPEVRTIGEGAFDTCISLKKIQLIRVESVGDGAFAGCSDLKSFIIPPENKNLASEKGMLFNYDKTELLAFPTAVDEVILPDSVRIVHAQCFYSCDEMTRIVMRNVQIIGEEAFAYCSWLTKGELPDDASIGKDAFYCAPLGRKYGSSEQ